MTNRIRSATACLFLVSLATLTSPFDPSGSAKPAQYRSSLTLADRVAYQYAIEEVYWRHRIWPKENPAEKPSLDAVITQQQIEKKVGDYLRDSQALEDYWQRPITAEQLQAEMKRMAEQTKQPDVLKDLFEALGNDPFVIAECLARPALAQRLLTGWYAYDQRIHGGLRQRAEAELKAHPTVEQMRQISGRYSEVELLRSNSSDKEVVGASRRQINLNNREWDETIKKLASGFEARSAQHGIAAFESADISAHSQKAAADVYKALPLGKLSALREEETRYYATAVLSKTADRLTLAILTWDKEPLPSWLATNEIQILALTTTASDTYTLPLITGAGCSDDTWTDTSVGPDGRTWHTAVWTGSEMIVWGGLNATSDVATGWRYHPSTDTWVATSVTNAPAPRELHAAVWTGEEMLVWGGRWNYFGNVMYLASGGRYNPTTDTWTATNGANVPVARILHTAVWTGSEMIIWGGSDQNSSPLNTGGRYNPSTNSWTATSTTNAPSARTYHTAIWTGSEMVVWGGEANGVTFNTGSRYSPNTNSWTATSVTNAPTGREAHTAVWAGSEMIVWGGYNSCCNFLNSGGRYNPTTDNWIATSTTNAPAGRTQHTAVWTGSTMIVWGGYFDTPPYYLNTGGRYDPSTDSWTATNTTSTPIGRYEHTAVWTGNQMIVWGGFSSEYDSNTGGRYDPITDSWTPTAFWPSQRSAHTAVWTGSEMIVWGGNFGYPLNTGSRYDPSTDNWRATSTTNVPAGRSSHSAVWTGTEMIVWGGDPTLNTGGRYDPGTDSWIPTTLVNVPSGREGHSAVWSGTEMIIWGGYDSGYLNTGGKYNPGTDSWIATSTTNAPSARILHTAVWTGSEMITWGGLDQNSFLNTGGRYNSGTNSWVATSTTNAPSARWRHTAVWTGNQMIVWAGEIADPNPYLNTGGRYDPSTDSWTATNTTNAPTGRQYHTAVWTGSEMIVWGGETSSGPPLNTGGRYNPFTDNWRATSITNAPAGRYGHTAVWTSAEMIVWGGAYIGNADFNTGGRYCARSGAPMALSAVSRKTHGGAGAFDVNLPLTGTPGIECRTTGGTQDYTMVVTFSGNVAVTGNPQAQVTSGSGCVGSAGTCTGNVTVSGNTVTIPLTNITNAQTINVRINGVNSAEADAPATDFTIPMSILIGDTSANSTVNAADVAQTKSRLGQTVDATNFRSDLNANGSINAADTAIVKQNSGTSLPP